MLGRWSGPLPPPLSTPHSTVTTYFSEDVWEWHFPLLMAIAKKWWLSFPNVSNQIFLWVSLSQYIFITHFYLSMVFSSVFYKHISTVCETFVVYLLYWLSVTNHQWRAETNGCPGSTPMKLLNWIALPISVFQCIFPIGCPLRRRDPLDATTPPAPTPSPCPPNRSACYWLFVHHNLWRSIWTSKYWMKEWLAHWLGF